MQTQKYAITLTGESPLLMHADDLKWRSELDRWLANPENKRLSKAGDDRTPAWKWLGQAGQVEERGKVRLGGAWLGEARNAAWHGQARRGRAWHGMARNAARHGWSWRGEAGRGMERGWTRRGIEHG